MGIIDLDALIHALAVFLVIKDIQGELGVGLVWPLDRAGGPGEGWASPIFDSKDNVSWSLVRFLNVKLNILIALLNTEGLEVAPMLKISCSRPAMLLV